MSIVQIIQFDGNKMYIYIYSQRKNTHLNHGRIIPTLWILHIILPIWDLAFNPLKPEFTIFIFIYYKTRIAVAILDL